MWSKLPNLICPLSDNRFGYDDECASFGVSQHGRNHLYSLTQTHLVAKEAAFGTRCLIFHCEHPQNTLSLIGCKEASIKAILCTVILFLNLHGKHLLRKAR